MTQKQAAVYRQAEINNHVWRLLHCEFCGVDLQNVREDGVIMMQQLCERCVYEGGLENEHNDGVHVDEIDPDCPRCQIDRAIMHAQAVTEALHNAMAEGFAPKLVAEMAVTLAVTNFGRSNS